MIDKIKNIFSKKNKVNSDEIEDFEEENLEDISEDNDLEDNEDGIPKKDKKKKISKNIVIGGAVGITVLGGILLKPMLLPNNEYNEINFNDEPIEKIIEKPITKKTPIKKEKVVSELIEKKILKTIEKEKTEEIPVTVNIHENKMIEVVKHNVKKSENQEDKIINSIKTIENKIHRKDFTHDSKDKIDPFAQEFEGTINSRTMRSEINENIKLMREYIQFLETKKSFNDAKKLYEKEKQKNLFDKEVSEIKNSFSDELSILRSKLTELKQENSDLKSDIKRTSNKIDNDMKNISNTELVYDEKGNPINSYYGLTKSKQNKILEDLKSVNNMAYSQKVYRIGSKYILEEMDQSNKTVVYKKGNLYKGAIIKEINPTMIKVEALGETMILPISGSTKYSNNYTSIKIKMPNKLEIETTKNKEDDSVMDYKEELNNRNLNSDSKNTKLKSRFL